MLFLDGLPFTSLRALRPSDCAVVLRMGKVTTPLIGL